MSDADPLYGPGVAPAADVIEDPEVATERELDTLLAQPDQVRHPASRQQTQPPRDRRLKGPRRDR